MCQRTSSASSTTLMCTLLGGSGTVAARSVTAGEKRLSVSCTPFSLPKRHANE